MRNVLWRGRARAALPVALIAIALIAPLVAGTAVGAAPQTHGMTSAANSRAGLPAAGQLTWVKTGTVVRIADGDTVLAKVPGEITQGIINGKKVAITYGPKGEIRYRFAGIQSMERGECHAIEAQLRLAELLPPGAKITVKALNKESTVPNGKGDIRPLRLIFAGTGPNAVDVQAQLLREGLVLPNSVQDEIFNEQGYMKLAQEAAALGIGDWDSDHCGVGPDQSASLKIMVNYNADGNDALYPERRFARILNTGTQSVNIAGWYLRTGKHSRFYFPKATVIAPGGSVEVRMQDNAGKLTSGNAVFYWKTEEQGDSFINPDTSKYGIGAAYLVDPDGDIRFESLYPCQVNCSAKWPDLSGKVSLVYESPVWPVPQTEEALVVTNTSAEAIDLGYYVIDFSTFGQYEFPRGTTLAAGADLRVYINKKGVAHSLKRPGASLPSKDVGWPSSWSTPTVLRSHESVVMACVKEFDLPC